MSQVEIVVQFRRDGHHPAEQAESKFAGIIDRISYSASGQCQLPGEDGDDDQGPNHHFPQPYTGG